MKTFVPLVLLLAVAITVNAQKEGLNAIGQNDLKAYMSFFASDELKGRETGTPANDVAALYIKTNLMRLGLKPMPGTGDYLQKIPMVSGKIDRKETYLEANDANGQVMLKSDSVFILQPVSESMTVSGNVVFIGYGYQNGETGYDDLKGLDLKDKIVLVMTRNPEMVKDGKTIKFINNEMEMAKMNAIFSQQPKALLYVYDPANSVRDFYHSGFADLIPASFTSLKDDSPEQQPGDFLFLFINQHTADGLLKPTGLNLAQMQEKINSTGKPVSEEVKDLTVTLRVGLERDDFTACNVVGMIEGSDPVLKNECVVYTAHFDHEGVDEKGEVYNGADDNASGSMGLLEIAEAFNNLKNKPLRSIVFAWVNGEEKGLLGSQFYTEHPVFPMKNTLVDINLDMIGRSVMPSDTGTFHGFKLDVSQPKEILIYTAHESNELTGMLMAAAREAGVTVKDMGPQIEVGTSDHACFTAKGVPAFCFNSGIHSDLHTIRDDIDKIDFDKMERVSKMAFLLGYKAANQKKRITVDNPQ